MAHTLSWPNKVKSEQRTVAKKRHGRGGIFIGAGLALLLTGQVPTSVNLGTAVLFTGMVLCVVGLVWLLSPSNQEKRLATGNRGETLVAQTLDRLPNGWFIINDVVVQDLQIDHLAIGPGGIFCIETKHWNNAGCDRDGNWYRRERGLWVPRKENPGLQNAHHVAAIKKILKQRLNINPEVRSLIVLSNTAGIFNIQDVVVPPGRTRICWLPQLSELLLDSYPDGPDAHHIHRITELFFRNDT